MKFDPDRMRVLFEEIPAPDSLDRWRVEPRAHARSRPMAVAAAASALVITLVTAVLFDFSGTRREPTNPPTSTEPVRSASAAAQTRTYRGDLEVTTAGAVISDLVVTGTILVEAPNVTLRRVRVARESDGTWAVRQLPGATNLTIEDSEIGGDGRHTVQRGIAQEADGLVVRGTVVRAVQVGITVLTRATVENTRIVDLLHTDKGFGLVCHGDGSQITISGSTIVVPSQADAAVALNADNGPIVGVRLVGNVLGGGRSTLHSGGSTEVEVTGNRFRRQAEPVRWDTGSPKVWSNNTWEDTGAAVNL